MLVIQNRLQIFWVDQIAAPLIRHWFDLYFPLTGLHIQNIEPHHHQKNFWQSAMHWVTFKTNQVSLFDDLNIKIFKRLRMGDIYLIELKWERKNKEFLCTIILVLNMYYLYWFLILSKNFHEQTKNQRNILLHVNLQCKFYTRINVMPLKLNTFLFVYLDWDYFLKIKREGICFIYCFYLHTDQSIALSQFYSIKCEHFVIFSFRVSSSASAI